jgi:hypothetical protein
MNVLKGLIIISVSCILNLQVQASPTKNPCYERIVELAEHSSIKKNQSYSIKVLYNQAILNRGTLLDKLHKYILEDGLKEDDKIQVNALYIAMIDEGYICGRLAKNKTYSITNIVEDIKALLKV